MQAKCRSNPWKHLRSEDALHAYREIGSMALSPPDEMPQARLAASSRFPRVMCTGTINGTLDDIMYGIGYHDTKSMRTHRAYQNGFMEDSAVLNALEQPTPDDPYRFLGIVWVLKRFPGVPTAVLRNRDSLLLNAIHTTTLPRTGERVGIYISHSVIHRDLPDLKELSTVRASISIMMAMRQVDASRVEMFIIDFMDTKGNSPVNFQLKEPARTLLRVTTWCDVAISKKLYWMLLLRHRRRRSLTSQSSSSTSCSESSSVSSGTGVEKRLRVCQLCKKTSIRGVFSSSAHHCKLCDM